MKALCEVLARLDPCQLAELERLVAAFEQSWQSGRIPEIADSLPADPVLRPVVLAELVHADLEYRLRGGDPIRVEAYLDRFPELLASSRTVIDLVAAEFELRRRRGPCELHDYLERFRQYATEVCAAVSTLPWRPSEILVDGDVSLGASRLFQQAAAGDPQPPLLGGRYRLLEPLGKGSCGEVHRARDVELDRFVAVKVPHRWMLAAPGAVRGFLREAQSAARLSHPGIVTVYDAARTNGACYLVSEYIDGPTLRARMATRPPGPDAAARVVAEVAAAVHFAHERGVIHRDIKPSNILLDSSGRPHLSDFGLAKCQAADATLTADGDPIGTPAYMSPEQAGGSGSVDARSDVYSLGVVLYELLTGQVPFSGPPRVVLRQVVEEEPRSLRRLDRRIPRDLECVCQKAMSKEPAWRYASAADLAADLRRYLSGEPVRARPLRLGARVYRWSRRRPAVASLALLLLIAVSAGSAVATWQSRRAREHLAERNAQQARAEQNYRRNHKLINDFLLSWQAVPNMRRTNGFASIRLESIELAVRELEELYELHPQDTDLRNELALAASVLGDILDDDGFDHQQAFSRYMQSLSLYRQMRRDGPDDPGLEIAIGNLLLALGRLERESGHTDRALSRFEESCATLAASHPAPEGEWGRRLTRAIAERTLGELYCDNGRMDLAQEHSRQAAAALLELFDDPTTVDVFEPPCSEVHELSRLQRRIGSVAESLRLARRAHELLGRLRRPQAAEFERALWLAQSYDHVAVVLFDGGEVPESIEPFLCADEIIERFSLESSDHYGTLDYVASHFYWLAGAHRRCNRLYEALKSYEHSFPVWRRLMVQFPERHNYRDFLGATLHVAGKICGEIGKPDRAVDFLRQALAVREQHCHAAPDDRMARSNLSGTLFRLGEALEEIGEARSALAVFRRALDEERSVLATQPEDVDILNRIAERQAAVAGLAGDQRE